MTNKSLTRNPSLRERVQARLTHLDLGGYELDWLDSRRVSVMALQLQWLDDAASEARVDGDTHSADTYDEILEVIQIETQLARELSQLMFAPATGDSGEPVSVPPYAFHKAHELAEQEVGHGLPWQEAHPMPGATAPRLLIGIAQLLDGSYRATWQLHGSCLGERDLLISDDEFEAFQRWRLSRDTGPFGFSGAGRGPNRWAARADR